MAGGRKRWRAGGTIRGSITMLIGIDASKANKKIKTGIEYYSLELLLNLAKIDEKNQYILYSPDPLTGKLKKLPKNFKSKVIPFWRLWSQVRLSWETIISSPDVLFVPAHTIPIAHPKKTVITVHDLGFEHFPNLYPVHDRLYHKICMRTSVRAASEIIAVSEYTKNDLIKRYPKLKNKKITVIHHGFDPGDFKPVKKTNESPYIFYIGRLQEKKNITGLVKAYGILRKNKKIKHQLILAGKPDFGFEKIENEINSLPNEIKKDVKILGYIDHQQSIKLMQEADIFAFPSFFEGFGMPILEAMACGVPVAASNLTSIPEVVGEAGILFNPHRPKEIAGSLEKLITNQKLYNHYRELGLKRVKDFSWEKCARETLKIIERVGKN